MTVGLPRADAAAIRALALSQQTGHHRGIKHDNFPWGAVMWRIVAILFWLVQPAFGAGATDEADGLGAAMVNPGYHDQPDWFKQSFLDIREDIKEASQAGRRVVLYFYQDGCPYCKKLLEINFSQREIVDEIRRSLDLIAINMWGDREVVDFNGESSSEKQFAAQLKVMFTPTLLFLDELGQVVMRLNGYYPPHKFATVVDYVAQRKEKELSFRDYWAEVAPAAAS